MSWWSLSNLRFLLTTETDDGSPVSEEMVSQLRELVEHLFMLNFDTGITGSLTSDPVSANETGSDNSGADNKTTSMVDTTKNFVTEGVLVGDTINNTTDGSTGVITSITTTTNTNDTLNFSAGLSGGTDNDFDDGDSYDIETQGTLFDTAQSFTDDEHIGKTLLVTSGNAIGNFYEIDDNTSTALSCRGETLYSDGVRSGDSYKILYDIINNADGHNHDNLNSATPTIANNTITKDMLKVGTGYVYTNFYATGSPVSISLQRKCFGINFYGETNDAIITGYPLWSSSIYTHRFALERPSWYTTPYPDYGVAYEYMTSSDEPFIYALQDKKTGEIKTIWSCEDPPPDYWGLDSPPASFVPPIVGHAELDKSLYLEIILFKYNRNSYFDLQSRMHADEKSPSPLKNLNDIFEYDSVSKMFKLKNLSMI